MTYHWVLRITTKYNETSWSSTEKYGVLQSTMEYHRLPQNSMEYHGERWTTMKYHKEDWSATKACLADTCLHWANIHVPDQYLYSKKNWKTSIFLNFIIKNYMFSEIDLDMFCKGILFHSRLVFDFNFFLSIPSMLRSLL